MKGQDKTCCSLEEFSCFVPTFFFFFSINSVVLLLAIYHIFLSQYLMIPTCSPPLIFVILFKVSLCLPCWVVAPTRESQRVRKEVRKLTNSNVNKLFTFSYLVIIAT